jgi:predicted Zn finger-like uncharacterized protein
MLNEQATRCPSCATVFRVAQAQLLAYNGWVRCGRCQEVFNAESCLVELDTPLSSAVAQATVPNNAPAPHVAPQAAPLGTHFDLQIDAPPAPWPAPGQAPASTVSPAPLAAPPMAPWMPQAWAGPVAGVAPGLAPPARDSHTHFGDGNMVERAVRAMRATPGLSPPVEVSARDLSATPATPMPAQMPAQVPAQVPVQVPAQVPEPGAAPVHTNGFEPLPQVVTAPGVFEPVIEPTPAPVFEPEVEPASATVTAPVMPPTMAPAMAPALAPAIEPVFAPAWAPATATAPEAALLQALQPISVPVDIDFHAPVEEAPEPPWHPDLIAERSPRLGGRQRGGTSSPGEHQVPVAWRTAPELEPAGGAAAADPNAPGGLAAHADGPAWATGAAAGAAAQAGLPSFVRHAQREAWWRQPKVRLALAGACAALLLCLGLQAAFEYRETLAAKFEITRPALEAGCRVVGCSVGAPRLLDAEGVSVENSGLVRVEKTNTYKLSLALRNRAATAVAVPALELSLTDSQGKLMARRVLRASDFGVTQTTVPAGRELGLQATLQTAFSATTNPNQEPVAGYTIELFYP